VCVYTNANVVLFERICGKLGDTKTKFCFFWSPFAQAITDDEGNEVCTLNTGRGVCDAISVCVVLQDFVLIKESVKFFCYYLSPFYVLFFVFTITHLVLYFSLLVG